MSATFTFLEVQYRAPNRVEWRGSHGQSEVRAFTDPAEAYRFWISLPPGVLATLYQNGQKAGRGDGLE